MATYRLDLEYEGTRYRGWQEQANARSVAGELRRAVAACGGAVLELAGAGRTDAGVHALGQVAHLRLGRAVDPGRFRTAVNDALPQDIHVLAFRPVPDRFHARHDAVLRSYLYQISRRRTALGKRGVQRTLDPEDAARMAEAAALLEGMHDFSRFCERPQDQVSTKVAVERAEIACEGALILFRIAASHFLWKMVRRIVGTLIRVGASELSAAELAALIDGRAPSSDGPAAWTAPPSGLYLEKVLYREDPPLPPIAAAIPVAAEPPASAPKRTHTGR